jgi:tetratricopeptide (TPR) repeat protein
MLRSKLEYELVKERSEMDTKDIFTLTLSGFAFVLSLATNVITFTQKKDETQRGLRQQITDVIGKLNGVFEQDEKLRREATDRRNEPDIVNLRSFYNGQKLFYARQAIFLIENARVVTEAEYNTIARAFASNDDFIEADRYFQKAIAAAPTPFYKAINHRGHARVLFALGRVKEGQDAFKKALELVNAEGDINKWFHGETYQRWAMLEREYQDYDEAEARFHDAELAYQAIRLPGRQKEGLSNLSAVRRVHAEKEHKPTPELGKPEA